MRGRPSSPPPRPLRRSRGPAPLCVVALLAWLPPLRALGQSVERTSGPPPPPRLIDGSRSPQRSPGGANGAASTTPALQTQIVEIVVLDATKTTEATIRSLAGLRQGDLLDPAEVDEARRRLLASGLFRDVTVFWESAPAGNGARVVISVVDKLSWVVAPTFAAAPANVGGGLVYGENNLFGQGKKLVLQGQLTTAESVLYLGFLNPLLFGIPALSAGFEALYRREVTPEYGASSASAPAPLLLRETDVLQTGAGGYLSVYWFQRVKATVYYRYLRVANEDPEPPATPQPTASVEPFTPGLTRSDAHLRFGLSYTTQRTYHAVQEGIAIEGSYLRSSPTFGSDYDYYRFSAQYRQSFRILREHNLRLKAEIAVGVDLPFHAELTSGGSDLRGFVNRQFRGDTKLAGWFEYHVPLFNVGPVAFRALAFYDLSSTYFRTVPSSGALVDREGVTLRNYLPGTPSGIGGSFAHGAGGGLRLYVRNIVLPLLGIDVAYGLNSGEARYYFVVGATSG